MVVAAADNARRGAAAGGEARRAGSGAAGLARKAALACGAAGHAIGRAAGGTVTYGRRGGGGAARRAGRGEPGVRESLSLSLCVSVSGVAAWGFVTEWSGVGEPRRVGRRVGARGCFRIPARGSSHETLAGRSAVTRL